MIDSILLEYTVRRYGHLILHPSISGLFQVALLVFYFIPYPKKRRKIGQATPSCAQIASNSCVVFRNDQKRGLIFVGRITRYNRAIGSGRIRNLALQSPEGEAPQLNLLLPLGLGQIIDYDYSFNLSLNLNLNLNPLK